MGISTDEIDFLHQQDTSTLVIYNHVDIAFMNGWYHTIHNTYYQPGIYGVFSENSKLLKAYQAPDYKLEESDG